MLTQETAIYDIYLAFLSYSIGNIFISANFIHKKKESKNQKKIVSKKKKNKEESNYLLELGDVKIRPDNVTMT